MGTEAVARETRETREKGRAGGEEFYLELRESGTEGKQGTGSGGKRLPAKHAKYANGEEREGGDLYGTQGIRNGGVPEAVSRPTALVFVIFRAFWWPSFCGTQVYSELRKSGTEREGTGRDREGNGCPRKMRIGAKRRVGRRLSHRQCHKVDAASLPQFRKCPAAETRSHGLCSHDVRGPR